MKRSSLISRLANAGIAALVSFGALAAITAGAHADPVTTIYTFPTSNAGSPGARPNGSVVMDAAGNLWGTTYAGGAYGFGTVYKIDKQGQMTKIHDFLNGADGGMPAGNLIVDHTTGAIFGTTSQMNGNAGGSIFRITYSSRVRGVPEPVFTTIFTFNGADGDAPEAGVVQDSAGSLYGTTMAGGANDYGEIFKLTDPNGATPVLTVLHSFAGPDGDDPLAPVILDGEGNLFGTTQHGGPSDQGVVFRYSTNSTYTVLHYFNGTDGAQPIAPVMLDANGNLWGTTWFGGNFGNDPHGNGVVFELTRSTLRNVRGAEPAYSYAQIYDFLGKADGREPQGGLAMSWGGIYGTTGAQGAYGVGTLFRIDENNKFTLMHTFGGPGDGSVPYSDLYRDTYGYLYGTCSAAPNGKGTVYQFTP